MGIGSKLSGHWTDEQMIDHLYGIGPEDNHLAACDECRSRIAGMQARRRSVEERQEEAEEVGSSFLAAQRRHIYARLEKPAPWWSAARALRWASGAAALVLVGGGLTMLQQEHSISSKAGSGQMAGLVKESDAQLVEEVSNLANSPEPPATAPLQALFSE